MSKDKTKPQADPISTGRKSEDPRSKTWFQPGNNANPRGRPKGSRNKISEEFIAALCDDFEQHGVEVIEAVRTERRRLSQDHRLDRAEGSECLGLLAR